MSYRKEFPRMGEMPEIARLLALGFTDESYHNDVCPSFVSANHKCRVWIECENPEDREDSEFDRFQIEIGQFDPDLPDYNYNVSYTFADTWDDMLREAHCGALVPAVFAYAEKDFQGFYDPNESWNGFVCPRFTLAQAQEIAIHTANDESPIFFDGEKFTQTEEGETQTWEAREGLFDIGAFSWTWSISDRPTQLTPLPAYLTTPITNAVQAETFIRALDADKKLFHFEDSPQSIVNAETGGYVFSTAECEALDERRFELLNIPGFDPFELALALTN